MVNERARNILEDLEQTLLQFVRKHKITHDQYRCATEILVGSVKAGEESLLYDVFVEAATTDTDNTGNRGSVVSGIKAAAQIPIRNSGACRCSHMNAATQLPFRFNRARRRYLWATLLMYCVGASEMPRLCSGCHTLPYCAIYGGETGCGRKTKERTPHSRSASPG